MITIRFTLLYLFKRGPFRFDLFQTKALLSVFDMISLVKYSVELIEDVYQHEMIHDSRKLAVEIPRKSNIFKII